MQQSGEHLLGVEVVSSVSGPAQPAASQSAGLRTLEAAYLHRGSSARKETKALRAVKTLQRSVRRKMLWEAFQEELRAAEDSSATISASHAAAPAGPHMVSAWSTGSGVTLPMASSSQRAWSTLQPSYAVVHASASAASHETTSDAVTGSGDGASAQLSRTLGEGCRSIGWGTRRETPRGEPISAERRSRRKAH